MVFGSKRDPWLVLTLLGAAFLSLYGAFAVSGPYWTLLFVALWAWLVWIVIDTTYVAGRDELRIKSGPLRSAVKFADIISVEEHRGHWEAGPALSMDRVVIRTRQGRSIILSPRNKKAFLKLLYEECPEIKGRSCNAVEDSDEDPKEE